MLVFCSSNCIPNSWPIPKN